MSKNKKQKEKNDVYELDNDAEDDLIDEIGETDEITDKNKQSDVIDNDDGNDDLDDDDNLGNVVIENKKHSQVVDYIKQNYRKRVIIIKPENRITSDKLTSFEKTNLIGTRATIIEKDPTIFVDKSINALDIATDEFNQRKFPLYCRRLIRSYINNETKELIEEYENIYPNECIH